MKYDIYFYAYVDLTFMYILSIILAVLHYIITLDKQDLKTVEHIIELDMIGVFLIWVVKLTQHHYLIGYDIFWLATIFYYIIGLYIRRYNNDRRNL